MARREVAVATPINQTMITLDMLSDILWIVTSNVLLNCACVLRYCLLLCDSLRLRLSFLDFF
jgi:hypothetical protein